MPKSNSTRLTRNSTRATTSLAPESTEHPTRSRNSNNLAVASETNALSTQSTGDADITQLRPTLGLSQCPTIFPTSN